MRSHIEQGARKAGADCPGFFHDSEPNGVRVWAVEWREADCLPSAPWFCVVFPRGDALDAAEALWRMRDANLCEAVLLTPYRGDTRDGIVKRAYLTKQLMRANNAAIWRQWDGTFARYGVDFPRV